MLNKISEFFKAEAVRRTFHYYFLFIYLGLSVAITGPTLPSLSEQTGVRLGQMGYLFLLGSIGVALGTLLAGRLLDRLKGHPVMAAGQLVSAVLIMLIPVVPWFWLMLAIVFVKGMADAVINNVNTLLVWTHREKAGPFMNALHFFFGLGSFLAPFIIARLVQIPLGYRWAYWAIGIFGMILGLRLYFLPGSPKPAHEHGSENGANSWVMQPLVIVAALYLFFYVGAELTFGGWIYTYATTLNIFDPAGAAYLTSGFWFFFTLGRLISIPVATRFSPRQVIPAGLLGCLAIMLLVLIFPPTPVLLWLVTAVLGFCMAPLWPMGFTLAGQTIKLSARISSIILLGDSFGGMLLPWLVGQVIDLSGAGAMIAIVFASMCFNLLAFVMMVQLAKRQPAIA
ncbi:MAG TPA: MFS transporter [Anaerolineales bacterium]